MCLLEIILTNLATIDYCDMKFGNDVLMCQKNVTNVIMCGKAHRRVLRTNIYRLSSRNDVQMDLQCEIVIGLISDTTCLCISYHIFEACWCPLEFSINPRWLPNATLHVFISLSKVQPNSDIQQIRHERKRIKLIIRF